MSKPDLSAVAEQLCRIEHKLDLLLEGAATHVADMPLRPVGDPEHIDPTSLQSVQYQMDPQRNHVVRRGGGCTGIVPPITIPSLPVLSTNTGEENE